MGNDNEDNCFNIHFSNLDAVELCGSALFPRILPKRYS